jgi:hypothetical protein
VQQQAAAFAAASWLAADLSWGANAASKLA